MTAQAEMKAPTAQDERRLAEEIAQAMAKRPLMSRLDNIAEARAQVASTLEALEGTARRGEQTTPPPLPARNEPPPLPPSADAENAPQSTAVFDDTLPPTTPPSSVEWLRKARRERRRERMRQAGAWAATIAIGVAIIGTTAVMLQG